MQPCMCGREGRVVDQSSCPTGCAVQPPTWWQARCALPRQTCGHPTPLSWGIELKHHHSWLLYSHAVIIDRCTGTKGQPVGSWGAACHKVTQGVVCMRGGRWRAARQDVAALCWAAHPVLPASWHTRSFKPIMEACQANLQKGCQKSIFGADAMVSGKFCLSCLAPHHCIGGTLAAVIPVIRLGVAPSSRPCP